MNLGNYSSFRVEVGFEDSTLDGETSDQCFKRVAGEAKKKFTSEVKARKKELEELNKA